MGTAMERSKHGAIKKVHPHVRRQVIKEETCSPLENFDSK
jgi:hypothetical protein